MSAITLHGIYRDQLFDATGRSILDSGWKSNLIVTNCRVLLSGFTGGEATAKGIQSLRVGRGLPEWDVTPPPAPNPDTTVALEDPTPFIIPKASLTFQYLNNADAVVPGPTARLQIIATLGPNQPTPATDPPFPLREFGLFGEMNAQPFMIDYIRHPLIEKSGAVTLQRRLRLVF